MLIFLILHNANPLLNLWTYTHPSPQLQAGMHSGKSEPKYSKLLITFGSLIIDFRFSNFPIAFTFQQLIYVFPISRSQVFGCSFVSPHECQKWWNKMRNWNSCVECIIRFWGKSGWLLIFHCEIDCILHIVVPNLCLYNAGEGTSALCKQGRRKKNGETPVGMICSISPTHSALEVILLIHSVARP